VASPDEPRGPAREGLDERQVRRIALVGGVVLIAILLLVFITENSRTVRVSFVFFEADISLIWVIVLSAAGGAIAGALLTRALRRRFRREG
jgi:uncharacterized integral membrane protein